MTRKEKKNIAKAIEIAKDLRAFLTEQRNSLPVEKQEPYNDNLKKISVLLYDLLKEAR